MKLSGCNCPGLGDWTPDDTNAILSGLWDLGNQLFPDQTAKIQDFVTQQAQAYGINLAQQKIAQLQANPLTPFLLIGGAFLIGRAMKR